MKRRPIVALAATIVLFVGLTGVAAAAPGGGPPVDAPGNAPAFVSDLLGGLGDVAGGMTEGVLEFVDGLAPDAADDGIDAARDALSR